MDQDNFPAPGAVLWGVDVQLDKDIFRRGVATKPNVDFLRYSDLSMPGMSGRIEGDQTAQLVIKPGKGISLFLMRHPGDGFRVLTEEARKSVDKKLQTKIHWWVIDRDHPIPSGLELKYDGEPPGHCILTVVRPMTVAAFLALVVMVPFSPLGFDIVGPAS